MAVNVAKRRIYERTQAQGGGSVPPFTVMMWINPDTIIANTDIFWYNGNDSFANFVILAFTTGNRLQLANTNGSTGVLGPVVSTGTWLFVAATLDASHNYTLRWRLQGATSLTSISGTLTASTYGANRHLYFGSQAGGNEYDGSLAYGRFFTSVLTEAQILAESKSATAVLSAWGSWPFAAAASVTTDNSGNSRTLTSGGAGAVTDATGPTIAAGGPVDLGFGSTNAACTASAGTSLKIAQTQQIFILANTDDGQESTPGGVINLTLQNYFIVNTQLTGLRFQGVNIPRGATIARATISYVCAATKHNDFNQRIWCEAVDNSATLNTNANSISLKTKTTAFADYVNLNVFPDTSTYVTSGDISAPIQEIINRAGWAYSNAMTLLVTGFDGTNALSARSVENGAPARLDLAWIGTVSLTGSTNAAATCGSTTIQRAVPMAGASSAALAVRSSKTTTIAWDGDDLQQFTADLINPDEVPSGTEAPATLNTAEVAGKAEFWLDPWNDNGGVRSYSNYRTWLVWNGTDTFKDGKIKVLFAPPLFQGGTQPNTWRPQHGIMARWVDGGDHHRAISLWHDITVPFPGIMNFAVFRSERPNVVGSSPPNYIFRSTSNTGGFGMGQSFPYWLEAEFTGEKVRIRVWNDGDTPPAWDAASLTAARDLSEAATPGSGNSAYSRTSTPTEGKVGLFMGHMSEHDQSVSRFGALTVEQYDAMDVAQDIGASSANAAATATGTLSVDRPLAGASSAGVEVLSTLLVDRDLSTTGASAAAHLSDASLTADQPLEGSINAATAVGDAQLFGEEDFNTLPMDAAAALSTPQLLVDMAFNGIVAAITDLDGTLTVIDGGPDSVLPSFPGTLTAIGDPLTLTPVGESLTLVALGE